MNLLVVFLTLFATANGCYSIANGTSYYLSLNTTDLYNAALSPNRIGSCYILRARGREACDLYIKSAVPGTDGDYGWPKTGGKSPRGNGCVIAPNLPKGVDSCFYWPRKYWMSWDDKLSFCQGDGMENAVTQLRHALRHNACGLDYIAMGEDDLWAAATGGNKVGGCYIEEFSHFPVLCFAFVKTATTGVKGVMGEGWPRTTDGIGNGCVRPTGDWNKCYEDPKYMLTTIERSSFCTGTPRSKAVAQLKHAILPLRP